MKTMYQISEEQPYYKDKYGIIHQRFNREVDVITDSGELLLDCKAATVLIKAESDLEKLPDSLYCVGSVARIPGTNDKWEKTYSGWKPAVSGDEVSY